MKINEFTDPLRTYMVTVRVVLKNSATTVRTTIRAENANQAYIMLTRLYGVGNVQSVQTLMDEDEDVTEATKTLSPQELQVKALSDKAKEYKEQAKATKARQEMAKAQQDLLSANRGASASKKL
jgi:hypothetical protein